MTDLNIFIKLASLPDEMKKEVNDFIDFLKAKATSKTDPLIERKSGLAKGLIKMKPDFDDPLDDFKEYMY